MKKHDPSRGPRGHRNKDATPSGKPTPAQFQAAREVTEQKVEQVQGGRAPARPTFDQTDE